VGLRRQAPGISVLLLLDERLGILAWWFMTAA
jgi:hypothetical protein